MHLTPLRPTPKFLPPKPKHNTQATKQRSKHRVRNNRWDEAAIFAPRSDKFTKPITPYIFIHGDGYENGARDGLVGVDGVG